MGINYRARIERIRHDYQNGKITIEEAEQKIAPMLMEMNIKGKDIAKRFGKKYKPLTFGYVFR